MIFFREIFHRQSYDKIILSTGYKKAGGKKAGFMEKVLGKKFCSRSEGRNRNNSMKLRLILTNYIK
ncbi:hypothetical protein EO98_13570 [Methanosarcina sp. 2.H.T.1A.6]|nr:hypothetical protein EO97_10550 [Methanosarcina sp. 2.H.T.1A.15]KKG17977.1 hypothetical protein EO94_05400 [Methanosarcina sp. 2.H.T.1A.3]KKG19927.1 hypothetical protein EO98_13570 [Methanosarcina sp. 2.H.T.1A.6]KKG22591.1 hypothetical protein EO96_12025 [Methanosarcina sp. 2.H.T.1A.8]